MLSAFSKSQHLMVWGCISAYSMGSLHVLDGTMNAESRNATIIEFVGTIIV